MNTPAQVSATRPIRTVSVLMPTWQAMEFLERVLDALESQECETPWDVHIIDSGSTDGSWECMQSRVANFPVPLKLYAIPQPEFDHGDTRNQLAARSSGDLLVYLTQDAIPSHSGWLAGLVRNFEDKHVGAAYSRNVPRDDAELLTRVFSRTDPGYGLEREEIRMPAPEVWSAMANDERRLHFNFNNVSSAVRRELWELHPFPRTHMGEDVLIGRGIMVAGYTIVFDAEATVDHSHDYAPPKMRWRGHVDAKFNAEWMERINLAAKFEIEHLCEELVEKDMLYLEQQDTPQEQMAALREEASSLRGSMLLGMYEGGLSHRRYPLFSMRSRREVALLFVVDSLKHEDSSKQQALLPVARKLAQRGHKVVIFELTASENQEFDDSSDRQRRDLQIIPSHTGMSPESRAANFRDILVRQQIELVHFHCQGTEWLHLLPIAYELDRATLVSLYNDQLLKHEKATALQTLGFANLRAAYNVELRKRFIEAGDFDPQTFGYYTRYGLDIEQLGQPEFFDKTVDDEVAELEFRYRSLCGIPPESFRNCPLFIARGAQAEAKGETEIQGPGWRLLRPGSAAEYKLPAFATGPVTLDVEQYTVGAEDWISLEGRVLIDGKEIAKLMRIPEGGQDRTVLQSLDIELPAGSRVLSFEPRQKKRWFSKKEPHMRLARVILRHRTRRQQKPKMTGHAPKTAAQQDSSAQPPPRLQI